MKFLIKVLTASALLTLSTLLGGCRESTYQPNTQHSLTKLESDLEYYDLYIIEIDGCEYLKCGLHYKTQLTHKGNCKNPIHQYNTKNPSK